MRLVFSCGAALQGPQWGRRRPAPWGMLGRRPCGGGSGEVQGRGSGRGGRASTWPTVCYENSSGHDRRVGLGWWGGGGGGGTEW